MIKEKKNRRIRTASRGPSSSPVPSNPPRRSGRRGGSIRTGELRRASNQSEAAGGRSGRPRAAPALRHSTARRRVASRRGARLPWPAGPPLGSSVPPQTGTSVPSASASPPGAQAVAHPSRTPPISSIPRRGPAPPTFRTINFGGVIEHVKGDVAAR